MVSDDTLLTRGQAQRIGRAGWLVPAREDRDELLDLGVGTPADVQQSLDDLWRINRYLSGISALTRHLYPRLASVEGTAVCVDLGAGAAQISGAIATWARRRRQDVRVVALDFSARNLDIASRRLVRGVSLLQADAMCLPFAPASVDFLTSSLFLHHFTPQQVIALLRSAYAAARRGLVMCDLVRGWLPLIGFKLAQPVFARSYITRYDGAVSIRRAYTPDELRELADAAGLKQARVHAHWPWRMTLVVDK